MLLGAQLVTGCCDKKECNSVDDSGIQVIVEGFNTDDTLVVYSYARNSGFRTVKDSFFTRVRSGSNPLRLPRNMDYSHDFRLLLGAPAEVYEIRDLVLEKAPCNYCLFTIPKDHYRFLKSYIRNGKRVEGRQIVIAK